jgi:drug/metabolite transporter (DMT)-like permease
MMNLNILFWLIVMALLWGPSFLFMKVAVEEIPPVTMIAVRLSLAAIVLYAVLRSQGRTLPKWGPIWKDFTIMGLFSNALPFVLLSWGEQFIDSALAAILIGTTPIFTVILAHLFTADDHLTPAKIVGLTLGFGGLVVLVSPALMAGVEATTWGLLAAVLAAASYGAGIVYGQQRLRGLPPLVGPTAQVMTAALLLLPLSFLIERPYAIPVPSWTTLGSLLGLALLGTALAYIVYYRTMERTSATVLSTVTYIVPVVATILGVVVLKEQLDWNAYLGFGMILLGVMVVNGVIQLTGWRQLTGATSRP